MERFKDYVVNYAYATGVCVRSDETIQHIPMSLYPRQVSVKAADSYATL